MSLERILTGCFQPISLCVTQLVDDFFEGLPREE
jgi:hypothetical protein